MKSKKAQGLSINMIIVAIIALLVLVIIAFIVTGKFNLFQKSTTCQARDGTCLQQYAPEGCTSDEPIKVFTDDCYLVENDVTTDKKPGQCCIPIGN